MDGACAIDLYWIPLGAGGYVVRHSGRVYEAILARRDHRRPEDLYHAALVVLDHGQRYVIEMAPIWNTKSPERGVVRMGPVGLRVLGRFRAFRYEVRCWLGGQIPDLGYAVDSPRRVSDRPTVIANLLSTIRDVPALTWGRDELHAGEMWNSNSLVAWLLARVCGGCDVIRPPAGGRAPGWNAGLLLAARQASA